MFFVIELQTYKDGTTGNIVTSHATWEDAQSKYHTVLSAAAISSLPQHSAALLRSDGFELEYMSYEHE